MFAAAREDVTSPAWTRARASEREVPLVARLRREEPPVPADEELPPPAGKPISRLPPPPSLGTLAPGGRSSRPPRPGPEAELALQEQANAFAEAAVELAIARAAALAAAEGQLLDLSIEIAAAIVEHEVAADAELHAGLARAALASMGDATRVTLRTSSDGFAVIVRAFGGESFEARGVHVTVVVDDAMPGLGCIVEGEALRVDATVAERLRAVRRAFEDERRKRLERGE